MSKLDTYRRAGDGPGLRRPGQHCPVCMVIHSPIEGSAACRSRSALGLRDQCCKACGDAYHGSSPCVAVESP